MVWLPLARETVPAPESDAPASDGTPANERRPLRILVVDDDEDNRNSLKALLELYGYHVMAVMDGHAALTTLQQWRADLAIIDLGLPGMNGCEVARHIRWFKKI